MTDWLLEWQTLVGALVGSAGALLVAELVASSARWGEARAAIGHLLLEFQRYRAEAKALRDVLESLEDHPASRSTRDAVPVIRIRPRLSVHYHTAAAQSIGLDPYLGTLITMIDLVASHADGILGRACDLHDGQLRNETVGYTSGEILVQLTDGLANLVDAAALMKIAAPRLEAWSSTRLPSIRGVWYRYRWRWGKDRPPTWHELQTISTPRRVRGVGGSADAPWTLDD